MTARALIAPGSTICLLGGVPGAAEHDRNEPFAGPAGRELQAWCRYAGVEWEVVSKVNVFGAAPALQPEPNGLVFSRVGRTSHYLTPEATAEAEDARALLAAASPNIIVALGQEALWLASGGTATRLKGAIGKLTPGPIAKYLPLWHPSHIIRGAWGKRVDCIVGMMKAVAHCHTPDADYPTRYLLINPTIEEVEEELAALATAPLVSVDVETVGRFVTEIAFATSRTRAVVVPFRLRSGGNYWATAAQEVRAWKAVRAACAGPAPKLLQNGLYDAARLWDPYRIPLRNYCHDTRLLSSALFPELPKSLRWMGAVWEHERDWKTWNSVSEKKDD